MSKEPKSAAQDDFVLVINDITIDRGSTTKYLPFDCQKKIEETSEELELLKQENCHNANQLQTINEMKQSTITFFDYQKKIKEMSEELDLLKQEICQYANQLQTANEEKQSLITSLHLLANN